MHGDMFRLCLQPSSGQHVVQIRYKNCAYDMGSHKVYMCSASDKVYIRATLSMYSYCCLCILIVRPCILIVVYVFLDAATLTEFSPCFFLGCKANARVIPAKTEHGPHSSKIVVLFYVLFVLHCSMYCLCVNVYCTTATGCQTNSVNKYIISYQLYYTRQYWECWKWVVPKSVRNWLVWHPVARVRQEAGLRKQHNSLYLPSFARSCVYGTRSAALLKSEGMAST